MAQGARLVLAAALLLGVSACSPNVADSTAAAEVRVEDDAVAAQLTEQLPSDHILSFDSRMGTAQVAALPQPLDVRGDAMRSYRAGDVVYWSTEQALVIFLTDGFAVPDDGVLTRIGAVVDGMDQLVGCERDCRVHFGATSSSLGRGGG